MEDDEETVVREESASLQRLEHLANKGLAPAAAGISLSDRGFGNIPRKQKRKEMKKRKRKEMRKQAAEQERLEQQRRLQDPAEQLKIRLHEQEEAEALEKERSEHAILEAMWLETERVAQEDAERRRSEEIERAEERKHQAELSGGEEDWEYVEEGPAEIIWEGNEIIVRKQKVRVPRVGRGTVSAKDTDRLISNPLPPQSVAFADHLKLTDSNSNATMLDLVEQTPNFGTEQDKTHCPFHIKTGVCRFGVRCSRAHVYPDRSCTLLMKNMYNGPGLAWEHDEGLEHTDEEVAQCYEEFYEDVHAEFLNFGEIINFKVCRNESPHLRGNVYVHFRTVDSAISAYNVINGRFYAGKQITCEFVGVTRWRVALCGEYMKAHHRLCSHGTACNFLHCFRNPQGEYDWADWDLPPPRSGQAKLNRCSGNRRSEEWKDLTENSEEDDYKWHDHSPKYDRHDYQKSHSNRHNGLHGQHKSRASYWSRYEKKWKDHSDSDRLSGEATSFDGRIRNDDCKDKKRVRDSEMHEPRHEKKHHKGSNTDEGNDEESSVERHENDLYLKDKRRGRHRCSDRYISRYGSKHRDHGLIERSTDDETPSVDKKGDRRQRIEKRRDRSHDRYISRLRCESDVLTVQSTDDLTSIERSRSRNQGKANRRRRDRSSDRYRSRYRSKNQSCSESEKGSDEENSFEAKKWRNIRKAERKTRHRSSDRSLSRRKKKSNDVKRRRIGEGTSSDTSNLWNSSEEERNRRHRRARRSMSRSAISLHE